MRILLVENNKYAASPARADLRDSGHEVTVAASGVDALYLAASQEWELLIIDCSAAELDGVGILRTLRNGGVATPVLLMNQAGDETEGADDVLHPGFGKADLIARVTALGRRPRRAAPNRRRCCGSRTWRSIC